MNDYYSNKLSAQRLMRVYEIAPPRVRRYLEKEVEHVLERTSPGDIVLELGCGYGRILPDSPDLDTQIVEVDKSSLFYEITVP